MHVIGRGVSEHDADAAQVAGLLGRALGLYATGEAAGFIASVLGAMLLLLIYRMAVRHRV